MTDMTDMTNSAANKLSEAIKLATSAMRETRDRLLFANLTANDLTLTYSKAKSAIDLAAKAVAEATTAAAAVVEAAEAAARRRPRRPRRQL